MDNPVDHKIDLGLVNYVKHPTNSDYIVFRLQDAERAASFEEALKAKDIWFEHSTEMKSSTEFHLFGVHKTDFKRVERINYEVEGKHKKPLISFRPLRIFIVLFGMSMLTLAIIGYCKQQKELASYNEEGYLINSEE